MVRQRRESERRRAANAKRSARYRDRIAHAGGDATGREISRALIAAPDSVEAALGRYEGDLFPRSAEFAIAAAENLTRFFGDGAPHSVVALFKGGGS